MRVSPHFRELDRRGCRGPPWTAKKKLQRDFEKNTENVVDWRSRRKNFKGICEKRPKARRPRARGESTAPQVLEVGITYLKIIVLVYPAVAVSVICARICQAFGEGMPLLVVTTIRVLVITAPLALYFEQIGKHIIWVWYAQVLAIVIATGISFLFLQHYFKKFHIVGNTSNS